MRNRAGVAVIALCAVAALGAGWLAPNDADQRFDDLLYAPPTTVHVRDAQGRWQKPFIYTQRLVNRLERSFAEDRARPVPLQWLSRGRLVTTAAPEEQPFLLLGADGFGRDVLSRLLHAGRISLGLALSATAGAVVIGMLVGGLAGYAGGWFDETLSRFGDAILLLPVTYVVLVLRAVMPIVMPVRDVFLLMMLIFIAVGWPVVARGVRSIVIAERQREYVLAAHALGASRWRVLLRHLFPATNGHAAVQAVLLVPMFVLAEATLSYVGFGFPDDTPSWGTMLHEAANVAVLGAAPWMLAPAAALFVVILGVDLAFDRRRKGAPGGVSHAPPTVQSRL